MNNSYWYRVVVALDQLANAFCGGNQDCTISGRCGYMQAQKRSNWVWRYYAGIIDWAFSQIEQNHCHNAWLAEPNEKYRKGSDLARLALGVLIVPGAVFIKLVLFIRSIFVAG